MTIKFWGEKKSSEDQRSDQSELTATRSQWGGPSKTLSPHTKVNVWNTADTATCFWIHFSFEWLSGPLWSSLTELPPTLLPSLHKGQIARVAITALPLEWVEVKRFRPVDLETNYSRTEYTPSYRKHPLWGLLRWHQVFHLKTAREKANFRVSSPFPCTSTSWRWTLSDIPSFSKSRRRRLRRTV